MDATAPRCAASDDVWVEARPLSVGAPRELRPGPADAHVGIAATAGGASSPRGRNAIIDREKRAAGSRPRRELRMRRQPGHRAVPSGDRRVRRFRRSGAPRAVRHDPMIEPRARARRGRWFASSGSNSTRKARTTDPSPDRKRAEQGPSTTDSRRAAPGGVIFAPAESAEVHRPAEGRTTRRGRTGGSHVAAVYAVAGRCPRAGVA